MANTLLSLAEKTFIVHGVDDNYRTDGRNRSEYRPMEVETKVLPHTSGSARLRLANTDILVGVKAEVDTPYPDNPNEGKLEFFVDCSANATPAFEGKGGDNLGTEISNTLTLAYQSSHVLDLTTLCILPQQKCWKLYVDVLILQCDGNLFDAVALAVKAALYSAQIPKVTTATLDGGKADIQLSDDPFDCVKLDVGSFPVLVTLCKNFTFIQIGENCVVDPTSEEEECSAASIVVAVMPNGRITSVVKTGYGSLQPSTLVKTLELAKDIGIKLNAGIMNALKEEDELGSQREIFGFLK
ncbi:exosome complex component RRP42 isoform X1 [Neodiprion lecontei]|uniref:Ribosomal RNA-processing protein 42 n=2 Tax=Neodiprion lecontei TaxID=441921 RepID=A0ABM3FXF8_NEOLC|nr:exosome complex component RRP42 isoform X1 [Neodiprion lecontei]